MFLKKMRVVLPPLLSLFLCYFLFRMPEACAQSVKKGIALCGNVVIPSLFLFLVLANFWLESGLSALIGKGLSPLTRYIFRLPSECGSVILMSLVGGFPVGISMTAQLLKLGRITQNEAERLSMFAFNAGPAFVIFAVGLSMLKSLRAGVLLYTSAVLSALTLGFFTGFFKEKAATFQQKIPKMTVSTLPFSSAMTASVSRASHSMLSICAWVILFYTVTACLNTLPLPLGCKLFLNCILEVTVGLKAAVGHFPLPVLAAILSFGGLSVHCQVLSDLGECGVQFRHFLVSRCIAAVLSSLFCLILLKFFPCETPVFSSAATLIPAPYHVSAPAFLSLLFMSILLILELDRGKEMC